METSTAPSSAARCSRNISRSRFRDSAKRVIHRPAGLLTTRRRFQTKQRVQLLCNGVSKQNNAFNYFVTAFQTKERVHPLGNGVFLSFIGSNPILSRLRPLFRDFVVRWYGNPARIPWKPPDFGVLWEFSSLSTFPRFNLGPARRPDSG